MEDTQLPIQENNQKLTDWKNEPTIMTLKADLESAKPSHDAQMSKIQHWTDLLNVEGKCKPKVRQGQSSVQPKLIRRQAEWRYSALSEPLLNQYKLVTVSPKTLEEEEAANQHELL